MSAWYYAALSTRPKKPIDDVYFCAALDPTQHIVLYIHTHIHLPREGANATAFEIMAATAATTKVTRTILTAIMLVIVFFIWKFMSVLSMWIFSLPRIENAFFRFEEGAKNKYSTPIDKNDDDNDA